MREFNSVYESEYFIVEELASGVYGVYSSENGGAVGNSGIVDLGDKVIVFDTFRSIKGAKELKKAAVSLTGKEVSYVINSHYHADHILGNCIFESEIPIISTYGTYKELKMLEKDVKFLESVVLEGYRLRLPDITFDDRLEIHGASRNAVLQEFSGGHTIGDAVLMLPEERIVFMGDLLFIGSHPWVGAGNPKLWVDRIHEFQEYDMDTLVPGHGMAGNMGDLLFVEEYIKSLDNISGRISKGELKLEEADEGMLPEKFRGLKGNRFLPNLKYYFENKVRL